MKNVQTHKTTSPDSQKPNRRKRGFTLMEILLVMALLGGLVVLTLGPIGKLLVGGQEDTTKIFVTDTMSVSFFKYRLDNGRFPSTEEGLNSLLAAPSGATNWRGPYFERKEFPLDPWAREYQYRSPGKKNTDGYDLFSFGSDGVESDDDVGNW